MCQKLDDFLVLGPDALDPGRDLGRPGLDEFMASRQHVVGPALPGFAAHAAAVGSGQVLTARRPRLAIEPRQFGALVQEALRQFQDLARGYRQVTEPVEYGHRNLDGRHSQGQVREQLAQLSVQALRLLRMQPAGVLEQALEQFACLGRLLVRSFKHQHTPCPRVTTFIPSRPRLLQRFRSFQHPEHTPAHAPRTRVPRLLCGNSS